MDLVLLMLASYGLCFGLMNDKAWWLTDRLRAIKFRLQDDEDEEGVEFESTFFDRMLKCPYCTGFHTGWMTWLLSVAISGPPGEGIVANLASVLVWSFASTAFCYLADTAGQWLEG